MVKKKRSSAPPPPPPPQPPQSPPSVDPDSKNLIFVERNNALSSFHRGNHKKALKIIKQALSRHPNSPVLHITQACLHLRLYVITISDSATKLKHLKNAVSYTKDALSRFPNAIGLSFIYNQVLFREAKNPDDYKQVIEQCEQALSIENPIDACSDVYLFEDHTAALNSGSKKEMIQKVKRDTKDLMEKAKTALLVKDKQPKDGGGGERDDITVVNLDEKFSPFEDQRMNRRRIIEAGIEKSRLLQQKLLLGFVGGRLRGCSGDKVEERRKLLNSKRDVKKLDRKIKVLEYWKKMNGEDRRRFLKVGVDEIIEHYSKWESAKGVLMEAVGLVRKTKKWKVWECFCCGKGFMDSKSCRQHAILEPIGTISSEHMMILPHEVDAVWVYKIVNGIWKPVDVNKTVKSVTERLTLEACKNDEVNLESSDVPREYDNIFGGNMYSVEDKWLLCCDVEREKMLEKIHSMLELFLSHKCLAPTVVSKMMEFTMAELASLIPGFDCLIPGLDGTPLSICLLGYEGLKRVFKFLLELSHSCQVGPGEKGSLLDDEVDGEEEFYYNKNIAFTSDFSYLLLVEQWLRGELHPEECRNAFAGDGTAVISVVEDPEDDGLLDGESFINWLYTGVEIGEQIESWKNLRACKKEIAGDVFQFFESEFTQLQCLCNTKCWWLECEKAFLTVKNMCFGDVNRRVNSSEYDPQSYAHLLFKRQDELVHVKHGNSMDELNVIGNVLKHAQAICRDKFGFEEVLNSPHTHLSDLKCDEYRKQRMKADYCVEMAIEEVKADITGELCKLDVLIMKSRANMEWMEQNFGMLSAYDYRLILLPLFKSFVQTHLEYLADKDAKEKADAATEALLAELALETNENVSKGSGNSRKIQEKLKDRKSKGRRKATEEATTGSEKHLPQDKEDAEKVCSPVASDGEFSDSGISVSVSSDGLKQQEEEHMCKIEYEVVKTKLDEILECQRQIENEAKQNHLVGKNEKTGGTISENVAEGMPVEYSKPGEDDDLNDRTPLKHSEAGTFPGNCIYFGNFKVTNFGYSCYQAHHAEPNVTNNKSGENNGFSMHGELKHYEPENLPSNASFLASWEENSDSHHHVESVELGDLSKSSGRSNTKVGEMSYDYDEISQLDPLAVKTENLQNRMGILADSEETITSKKSTTSGTQRTRRRRRRKGSHSCGKVKQDPSVQGALEKGVSPDDLQIGGQSNCLNCSFKSLNQNSEALLNENGKHEGGILKSEGQDNVEILDQDNVQGGNNSHREQKNTPLEVEQTLPKKLLLKEKEPGMPLTDFKVDGMDRSDVFGAGLKNDIGEYNCFLNVIIQSLWHIRLFQDEFITKSAAVHEHVGNPCIICGLSGIFAALSVASTSFRREIVDPTSLRIALSKLFAGSDLFQETQMNDAYELLEVILNCLHLSSACSPDVSGFESDQSNCIGSWECTSDTCLAHRLFGTHVFERMNCDRCGLESRRRKYSTFFHNINAKELRAMKITCGTSTFDELLKLVEMNYQLACDPEAGGCGKLNCIQHTLVTPPHVFISVLGWQTMCETVEDIKETLKALSPEIDIGLIYQGLEPGKKYCLVSVVCYYRQHYRCFSYSHEHEKWIAYDDTVVKDIGRWDDLLAICEEGRLQPLILFFEAIQ